MGAAHSLNFKSRVPPTRLARVTHVNNDDDAETLLVGGVVLLLMLVLCGAGCRREALGLFVCYTPVAAFGRRLLGSLAQPPRTPRRRRLCLRAAASDGLALGCLAPSLLLAALVAVHARSAGTGADAAAAALGPLRVYFWAALACAAQPPIAMWCDGSPLPSGLRAQADGVAFGVLVALVAGGGMAVAALVGVALIVNAAMLHAALEHTQGSFTIGEAATLAQLAALLVLDMGVVSGCETRISPEPLRDVLTRAHWCPERPVVAVGAEALLCGGLALAALLAVTLGLVPAHAPPTLRTAVFVGGIGVALGGVLLPWLTALVGEDGVGWLLSLVLQPEHLRLLGYWLVTLLLGVLLAAQLTPSPLPAEEEATAAEGASAAEEESTAAEGLAAESATAAEGTAAEHTATAAVVAEQHRARRTQLLLARKVYHGLAVALFVPAALYSHVFLRVALCAALPSFVLLEIVRCYGLPPLAEPLTAFLGRFLDARDGGTLVLTHIYLLLGCALPLVLPLPRPDDVAASGAAAALWFAPHAGLLVLGVGDSAASLVGTRFGRTKWPRSNKSLEGTLAAVGAMMALLVALLVAGRAQEATGGGMEGPPLPCGPRQWLAIIACTATAGVLEALTTQIDNLFLPIIYQVLLCLFAAIELPRR